jgi:hypothetical protein
VSLRGGARRRITKLTKVVKTHSEEQICGPAMPGQHASPSKDRGAFAPNLERT